MKTFKKQLVFFDEIGYKETVEKAQRKLQTFSQALSFAEKHIVVFDKESFAQGFVQFFKAEFYKMHQENNTLGLSIDKLLFVKDIDLTRLENLERTFKDDKTELTFDTTNGNPDIIVDRKPFERWTDNDAENERLKLGKSLIDVIEKASVITKIYPLTLSQATSGLVTYNMRTNQYLVNVND